MLKTLLEKYGIANPEGYADAVRDALERAFLARRWHRLAEHLGTFAVPNLKRSL